MHPEQIGGNRKAGQRRMRVAVSRAGEEPASIRTNAVQHMMRTGRNDAWIKGRT
jgi:hypothetical protein